MERIVRVRLSEDSFRKFKVYCAMNDMTMTQQIDHIVREFIKENNESIKIIKKD